MINRRRVMYNKKETPLFTSQQNPYIIRAMMEMGWISEPVLYKSDLENIPNFCIVNTTTDNLTYSMARFSRQEGYTYKGNVYNNEITFEKAGNHLVIINGSDDAKDYEFDGRGYQTNRIRFFWFRGVSRNKYALRNCFYSIGVFLGYSQYGTDGGRDYTIDENLHEGWMPLSSLDESWQITSEIETW